MLKVLSAFFGAVCCGYVRVFLPMCQVKSSWHLWFPSASFVVGSFAYCFLAQRLLGYLVALVGKRCFSCFRMVGLVHSSGWF